MTATEEQDTPQRKRHDDEFPVLRPDKPCCCPPRVKVWGSTKNATVALTNKMMEDEQLLVRADANASINPPGGPQVNADGSGGSELRTRLRKDVDMVESTTTYQFDWAVIAECPVSVAVTIRGDVNAEIPCAPDKGRSSLSRRRVLAAEDVNGAPRGSAMAVVVAIDCHGHEVQCQLQLNEP